MESTSRRRQKGATSTTQLYMKKKLCEIEKEINWPFFWRTKRMESSSWTVLDTTRKLRTPFRTRPTKYYTRTQRPLLRRRYTIPLKNARNTLTRKQRQNRLHTISNYHTFMSYPKYTTRLYYCNLSYTPAYKLAKFLLPLIRPFQGKTNTYFKYSGHFIKIIKKIGLKLSD